jgi:hypothetical protein
MYTSLQGILFFSLKVKSLRTIGGDNIKSTVRRLLSHLFTNALARHINWLGKGEKLALSKLQLKDLIVGKT